MSIGQGNITVQSKKEQGGTLNTANNGLSIGGGPDNVQLGGGLVQETHIGLSTLGTFSIDGGGVGGQSVLYFDENNTQYFYGIVGAGPVFITGMEITPVSQLFLYAAQKKAFSAVQGITDLVVTVGDVDNVGNGTKITVDDDAQTVEITNVPAGNTTDDFATFDGDQIKKIPAPVESGTYTPTISNLVNLTDATPNPWQYMRVGNVVTVSGAIDATINAAANTVTEFTFDLPINSDLPNSGELAGTLWNNETAKQGGLISDDGANTGFAQWYSQSTNGALIYLHFTYLITVTPP